MTKEEIKESLENINIIAKDDKIVEVIEKVNISSDNVLLAECVFLFEDIKPLDELVQDIKKYFLGV